MIKAEISKKSSLITLVELPPTQFGILDGDWGHDVYSRFRLPPRALPILTGVLLSTGWRNVKMISPVYHGVNGKLGKRNWDKILTSDVLGISSITRTSPQSMKLAEIYKAKNPNGIVIAGGMDPSYRVEEWLKVADIVVIGEGEKTFEELMEAILHNSLENVLGIAYSKGKETFRNNKRPPLTEEELESLPLPCYDEAIATGITVATLEQMRGCPHDCNFCLVKKAYGNKVKFTQARAVDCLRQLEEKRMNRWVFYTGDNFSGNVRKALALIEKIKASEYIPKSATAQVSAAAAKHPRLLQGLLDIGVRSLCVGFEGVTDASLEAVGKAFKAEQNTEAAKTFREAGFFIHAMLLAGTDAEDLASITKTVDWAQRYADSMQLFVPTPFPGTSFYENMKAEERIISDDWSLYDCQHCVIQPAKMTAYELQKAVFEAYRRYYSPLATTSRFARSSRKNISAAIGGYALSKGRKLIVDSPQSQQYLHSLRDLNI